VRTIRRFIDEEERPAGKASTAQRRPASDSSVTKERHQESAAAEETKPKAPVRYQFLNNPAADSRRRNLRSNGGLRATPSRPLEPVRQPRTPKQERPIAKAWANTKAETVSKKAREEELAKERRRREPALSGQWSHAGSGRDHSLEYGLFKPRDSGPESTWIVGGRQPA
jgi:hypothetical protein